MKFQVYDELPRSARGLRWEETHRAAIDAACEYEPKWIRVDELGGKSSTASGRTASLKRAADAYAQRTGLKGFEVKQRTADGTSYPFIRKLSNGGAS